jgi:hypothetical protein
MSGLLHPLLVLTEQKGLQTPKLVDPWYWQASFGVQSVSWLQVLPTAPLPPFAHWKPEPSSLK